MAGFDVLIRAMHADKDGYRMKGGKATPENALADDIVSDFTFAKAPQ